MGSRHLSTLLLRPSAPLTRIVTSRPSTTNFRCLRLPPAPSILPRSAHRHLNTTLHPQSTQAQLKEDPETLDAPATTDEDISAQIDSLMNRGGPSIRRTPIGNSGDEFAALRSTFGEDFLGRRSISRPQLDLSDMNLPEEPAEPVQAIAIPEEDKIYPRLNPAYGRTVNLDISKGRDIVRGISMLGSLVSRNKVRSDFMRQRYHERPGMKRKRLHSERWRARFKLGFHNVTKRVTELTRKGW
ncbi:hypothetical protein K504DRAFT_506089 [Pleomassaria siparia CBS 279.74]|uniref:Ribosomal protein S21 n=1 Tax=Pleomassaria siparia CBS 279.74 TaxID=1314801 RepID=A0A6G1JZX3_9PLEO|nr:hypothetical protein K504DRAFT_506089 [Pleomassaria siparia CBS 279.74]